MSNTGHVLTLSFKGIFFYAYETDAIVLHNITGYALNSNSRGQENCGFPESALGKVLIKLDSLQISYRVYKKQNGDPMNLYGEKLFEPNDNYDKYALINEEDEAFEFLKLLCEQCKKNLKKENVYYPGIKKVLDLDNPEVCEKLQLIKRMIEKTK